MSKVGDWLEERTGWRTVRSLMLDEPVPGGASFIYAFGSVLTFLLIGQLLTGVVMALYYSPSAQTAWASVAYLQDQVTMGWFLRGLHNYGASAMVICAGLHMFQVALYGAYKKPREVNWLAGVAMFGLILAFALTGYLLPWDQKGYWATKVATGIMGGTPVVGPFVQSLVQGGNEYGNLTLSRFFVIHVFLLPGAILALLGLHLALFRKHGVTPKWGKTQEQLAARTQPFWPDQLARDMIAVLVVLGVMAWLVWRNHGVELGAPADPASGYDARPEWYFLPLFQLLKYCQGALEPIATMGVPGLIGLFLVALPFVDRSPERSPMRRAVYLAPLGAIFVGAGALIVVAVQADAGNAKFQERQAAAHTQADKARTLALAGVPPPGGTAVYENDPAFKGERLFGERCAGCHVGADRKGPELTAGYNSRDWVRAYLLDPDNRRFFGVTKDIHKMKPVKLAGEDLDAVVEMIYAENGAAGTNAALATKGQGLFDNGSCSDCHSRNAADTSAGNEGPNLGGRGSQAWLTAFIADPKAPRLFGAANEMPAFGAKLSPDEIALLADYVRSLASR